MLEATVAKVKITEGILFFYGTSGRGLTLHAKHLMATLELGDTGSFPIPSNPYRAGEIIDITGTLAGGQSLRNGPAYYNGASFPKLWYEGSLEFLVHDIISPADSSQPVAKYAAFRLRGNLRAYQANNVAGNGGPPVFDVRLVGKGRATVHLSPSRDLGGGSLGRDARAWLYSF